MTRCPRCGSVAVRRRGVVVNDITLRAPTTSPSTLVRIASLAAAKRGLLRV